MMNLCQISVDNYKRVLKASISVLKKGQEYFAANGIDADEVLKMKLADDMLPFAFQINSIRHHSLHAVQGLLKGEFSPPPEMKENTYQGMIDVLETALSELKEIPAGDIEACCGKLMMFRMGKLEIPFSAENFVLSFSLPNLYFHATTAYDMLRIKGVPLGKADFLGQMAIGAPA